MPPLRPSSPRSLHWSAWTQRCAGQPCAALCFVRALVYRGTSQPRAYCSTHALAVRRWPTKAHGWQHTPTGRLITASTKLPALHIFTHRSRLPMASPPPSPHPTSAHDRADRDALQGIGAGRRLQARTELPRATLTTDPDEEADTSCPEGGGLCRRADVCACGGSYFYCPGALLFLLCVLRSRALSTNALPKSSDARTAYRNEGAYARGNGAVQARSTSSCVLLCRTHRDSRAGHLGGLAPRPRTLLRPACALHRAQRGGVRYRR